MKIREMNSSRSVCKGPVDIVGQKDFSYSKKKVLGPMHLTQSSGRNSSALSWAKKESFNLSKYGLGQVRCSFTLLNF